jgi:N-acetylmuramoyl-L-alanine amidase
MPSVLIETGFLTNEEEERYLKSDAGQDQMAFSIMRAFQQYKAWVDDKPDSRILAPLKSKEEDHEKEAEVNSRTEKTESNSQHTHVEPNVLFRVQIYQSPKKTSLKASVFKGRDDIWEYESDNTWKYTCGRFDKPEDAVKLQSELKKEGFTDAFVVAFNNNKRITLNEARKIMKK